MKNTDFHIHYKYFRSSQYQVSASCKTLMKAMSLQEYFKLILLNFLLISPEKQVHCGYNIQALGFLQQHVTVSLLT